LGCGSCGAQTLSSLVVALPDIAHVCEWHNTTIAVPKHCHRWLWLFPTSPMHASGTTLPLLALSNSSLALALMLCAPWLSVTANSSRTHMTPPTTAHMALLSVFPAWLLLLLHCLAPFPHGPHGSSCCIATLHFQWHPL
jgi:hypothetical protein